MPNTTIILTPDNPLPFRVFDNGDGTYSLAVVDLGTEAGPVTPSGPSGPTGGGTVGPQGPAGPQGQRGSLWFYGQGPPAGAPQNSQPGDMYLDLSSGEVWAVQGVTPLTAEAKMAGYPMRPAPAEATKALTA